MLINIKFSDIQTKIDNIIVKSYIFHINTERNPWNTYVCHHYFGDLNEIRYLCYRFHNCFHSRPKAWLWNMLPCFNAKDVIGAGFLHTASRDVSKHFVCVLFSLLKSCQIMFYTIHQINLYIHWSAATTKSYLTCLIRRNKTGLKIISMNDIVPVQDNVYWHYSPLVTWCNTWSRGSNTIFQYLTNHISDAIAAYALKLPYQISAKNIP